ncbi:MAG TPA: carboxypeptidase regulatory-like domain-containing protein [Casimicrobiaceae bacterium]
MNRSKSIRNSLLVAGVLIAIPALGMAEVPVSRAWDMTGGAATALPPEQVQGKVSYVSGGIGSDEATLMRKEEARFPLSLEFVKHDNDRNDYLAGVNVTIKGKHGESDLSTVADGPYLLATLPDGRYEVSADHDGHMQTRNVVIAGDKPTHIVFEW